MTFGLTEREAEEVNADWLKAQEEKNRSEQLRIQALGAAISRRDWWAIEQAYAAIRDEFDRRGREATNETQTLLRDRDG